jgi:alpha-1,6-mannosyltransferase
MLRNGAVRELLEQFRPDLIECQDSYNLPWAAIAHRKRFPETALVGGYFTDFPTVYVERPFSKVMGETLAGAAGRLCYRYCGHLYRRFDAVFALSENGGATKLRSYGVENVGIVPLGAELGDFGPSRRDDRLRRSLGVGEQQPLLIYVGRLDLEKKPQIVVDAFRKLPEALGARLVLLGEGPLREDIAALKDPRIVTPGFVRDRQQLARWLASSDIYVSGMADETFGVSIVEAQASGLPVVGVEAGAMVDRVTDEIGRLGPVDDSDAMAANILSIWNSDRGRMSAIAQVEARQYSWDSSMAALFGRLYRQAFKASVERQLQARELARHAYLGVPAE